MEMPGSSLVVIHGNAWVISGSDGVILSFRLQWHLMCFSGAPPNKRQMPGMLLTSDNEAWAEGCSIVVCIC